MNKFQLEQFIVRPMLKQMRRGYSEMSELAIMMIIAHESKRGKYIKQITGPALGLIQMEPETHDCTWDNGDSIWDNALLCEIITVSEHNHKKHPPADRLIYDLRYNVFMARQRLFMKPEQFPNSIGEMSVYLKKHWNSVVGSATNDSYANDYRLWDK